MILFKQKHVQLILDGIKTQTRRIGKKRWNIGAIHMCKTSFKKGADFAHVKILDAREELLGDMTLEDAHAEGYESIEDYKRVFIEIYGAWNDEMPVWVVDYKLVHCLNWEPDKEIQNEN